LIGENYSNRKVFMTFIRSNQNHQIIHRNITMKSTSIWWRTGCFRDRLTIG
jgi:hypothetical protein